MVRYVTTTCFERDHPEISVSLDAECGSTGQWLIDYFSAAVAQGEKFAAGQTVQIGWSIVLLKAEGGGALELWEPDYDATPIRWCLGANNTLRHSLLQRSICDALNCDPEFPTQLQCGTVSPGFAKGTEFYMSRDPMTGNDSGWVFGEHCSSSSEGEFQSLYQISLAQIEIIPFLALPPGALVTRTHHQIDITFGTRRVTSAENQFLAFLLKSPILI